MSWIEKLYETYQKCNGAPQFENDPLLPISHTIQQAHIEIVLDACGNFLRAKFIPKEETVIQTTEEAAGRVGTKPPPHPLCDKVQYCAADYSSFGGEKPSFYKEYHELLKGWCDSEYSHPKVRAVLVYVERGTVVADLVRERLLFCDDSGKLLTEWTSDAPAPDLFRMLTPKNGKRDQGDAFIRWRVEIPGDQFPLVSDDPEVRSDWMQFDSSQKPSLGLCLVTGQMSQLISSHPKRLRHAADGAKLISSNDLRNYTFRGRFKTGEEACGVSFEVSQKAHNALRWLINRQGDYARSGDQVFVAWATGGQPIPDPFKNTTQLLSDFTEANKESVPEPQYEGDAGQLLALRLKKLINGYSQLLGDTDGVVVMGLDSASPGRMAITYYRELTGSEFLRRVLDWHSCHAWHQKFSKEVQFTGAAAPRDIAEAAFGRRLDDKLRKATIERLLPCIIDGKPVPRDLVDSVVHRAWNRVGLKSWDWEKCLGIACGLYRGQNKEKEYKMSLEEGRVTRDYLYGRLLAIADHLEQRALYIAGENRDTNASRLMQRFAQHPCSTWRTIELTLKPYEARLRSRRPALLTWLKGVMDEIMNSFAGEDYTDDSQLSGEFLLGYHCQRAALWQKQNSATEVEPEVIEAK